MIKKQKNMNVGAAILLVIFSLLFFVLLFRFFSMQVTGKVGGVDLKAKAQQKYMKVEPLEAKRGTIYDRTGKVVAEDTSSFTMVAILDKEMTIIPKKPQHVIDTEKTAKELSKYIDLSESEIYRILTKKKKQVEFGKAGRGLTYEQKNDIEALKLPGIIFLRETKRFYPNGYFASHLVGYADQNKNKISGQLGIEKSMNKVLTGSNGRMDFESDLWGYLLPNSKEKVTPAKNGNDVYLTIDKKIQTFLEESLSKVVNKYNPKKVIAIVANPKTGEILAMGQRPTFDPMTRDGIEESWHNLAIEESFEPGSTMKVFTLAAAIEEKVFNPNGWYKSGTYAVGPNIVPDHNYGLGWGSITYLEGVQRSSNVAFAKIAKEQLGFTRFRQYLTKFGFDQPTGIDLPNEASGKILFRYPIEKVTTAFGQGTAITPIQQIQAATAIANDGKMMRPHVVEKIVDSNTNKTIKKVNPEVVGQPISADTAKQVRDILETVITSEKGTGYERYNITGYDVAGKTGTAQIPGPNGRYLEGHKNYVFSFLGMAPKDDPELIMYVSVQQPEIDESTNGAEPVSLIFKSVMKNSLQYMNIKPAKQKKKDIITIPDLTNMSIEEATNMLETKGIEVEVLGMGDKIISQVPAKDSTLLEGEKVVIKATGKMTIPNMIGWSLRDVLKVTEIANLKVNSTGNGYVTKQNIKEGTEIKAGDYLVIEMQTPKEQLESKKKKKDDNKEVVPN
ncbi:penicillin-binding protein [Bacillus massilinigeriensis]|uniref:penicillin-binding protein n=1 Tax=Bacillus massilionigeriensis TaxID=1805475 RepID=UPI00096B19B0|nr:penicillin-binding protein [Bacillus massilionigeriensis]